LRRHDVGDAYRLRRLAAIVPIQGPGTGGLLLLAAGGCRLREADDLIGIHSASKAISVWKS